MGKGERQRCLFGVLCALLVVLQAVLQVLDGIVVTLPPASEQDVARGKIVPLETPTIVAMRSVIAQFLDDPTRMSSSQRMGIFHEVLIKVPFRPRAPDVPRKTWTQSAIYQAMHEWPDHEWQKHFRLKRPVFKYLAQQLRQTGWIKDNECITVSRQIPVDFKVAVAIFHLAQGGSWFQTAMAAGISSDTVREYTREVCEGIVEVIKPQCMRKPTPEELVEVQRRFADRRHIANVGGAVDGTHVPFQPSSKVFMEDFHNYKGWYSILVVAVVNSFYMFVDAEVGHPGRMSDSTATLSSDFYHNFLQDREGWLGTNGMLISDGAFSAGDFVLTPYPGNALNNRQVWFNFAFSSTRMYVEQTFGMWKSRWRVCIKESQCSHRMITLMAMATMVLHNMCMVHHHVNDPPVTISRTDILDFMQNCPLHRCHECKQNLVMHCVHMNRTLVRSRSNKMDVYREELSRMLWRRHVQDTLDNVDQ